jgi:transposase InsO family protein
VEVVADEQAPNVIGFLARAVAWFNAQGIERRRVMRGNGAADLLRAFPKACRTQGLRHIRSRPHTPMINGKAERFIRTLCWEWAYAMAFKNSEERKRWLHRHLSINNRLRTYSALGWRSPQRCLGEPLH